MNPLEDPNTKLALEWLYLTFPRCFFSEEEQRRPLKIGIRNELRAKLPQGISHARLKQALYAYTACEAYNKQLISGTERIGLDGDVAGIVTKDEEMTRPRWKPNWRPRPKKIPVLTETREGVVVTQENPPTLEDFGIRLDKPKRASLDDLRNAARKRKKGEPV
jgi:hypothetical protein